MKALAHHLKQVRLFLERARSARDYKSVPSQVLDALFHKIAINTAFRDYHQYEFYKPGKTMEEKSRYVGLTGSRYWPYENNKPKFAVTLTDKYIQKTMLIGFGLPTARLLTTVGRTFDIDDLETFGSFLASYQHDVVLKPISSSGGTNILVLARKGDGFECSGRAISVNEVWEHLSKGLERGFLIEERAKNIDEVAALYPHSLNTFRVVTIRTSDGVWHSPACALKLGRGGGWVDNLAAGGIQVPVGTSGITYNAYDHISHQPITHHPDTGAPLNGITLSCHREIVELGLKASRKFGFMGTIGWDIAATDKGPLIVEGNTLWAPKFQIPMGGFITDDIAKGLRRRTMFTGLSRA